jgi:hypothetical protein
MKRKLVLANALMGLMILFAIFFQSIHSFEHLVKQLSEKKCHHVHSQHETEVTHGHDGLEKCFVCEFAFSSYHKTEKNGNTFIRIDIVSEKPFLYSFEFTKKFKGTLFSLRGPPVV